MTLPEDLIAERLIGACRADDFSPGRFAALEEFFDSGLRWYDQQIAGAFLSSPEFVENFLEPLGGELLTVGGMPRLPSPTPTPLDHPPPHRRETASNPLRRWSTDR